MSPAENVAFNALADEDVVIQLAISALDEELDTLGISIVRQLSRARRQVLQSSSPDENDQAQAIESFTRWNALSETERSGLASQSDYLQ